MTNPILEALTRNKTEIEAYKAYIDGISDAIRMIEAQFLSGGLPAYTMQIDVVRSLIWDRDEASGKFRLFYNLNGEQRPLIEGRRKVRTIFAEFLPRFIDEVSKNAANILETK